MAAPPAAPVERVPVPAPPRDESGHTAPHDEIVEVVRELVKRTTDHSVLIDTLANDLKSRGFRRPPGSPRLITRLRRIKELSVSPTGMITLVEALPSVDDVTSPEPPSGPEPGNELQSDGDGSGSGAGVRRRRRGRRGGRRRRRHSTAAPPAD